jgi:hypothetical protein
MMIETIVSDVEYIDYGYIDNDVSYNKDLPIANVIKNTNVQPLNTSSIISTNTNDIYNQMPIDIILNHYKKEKYFIYKLISFITITIIIYVLFVNLIQVTN